MDEQAKKVREATALGKQHEALAYCLGKWDVDVTLILPGGSSQTSQATATFEWLLEGRWLGQRLEGELMGTPYESFSILGYDSFAQSHVIASVSTADTALNVARGPVVDPTGKLLTLYGELDEYTTGELHKPYKMVTRIVDDNHQVVEVWDLGRGENGYKVLEFSYTRKKT